MTDLSVTLSWERLVALARRLGSQDCDVCPTDEHVCWRHRGERGYGEDECVECWLLWLTQGR